MAVPAQMICGIMIAVQIGRKKFLGKHLMGAWEKVWRSILMHAVYNSTPAITVYAEGFGLSISACLILEIVLKFLCLAWMYGWTRKMFTEIEMVEKAHVHELVHSGQLHMRTVSDFIIDLSLTPRPHYRRTPQKLPQAAAAEVHHEGAHTVLNLSNSRNHHESPSAKEIFSKFAAEDIEIDKRESWKAAALEQGVGHSVRFKFQVQTFFYPKLDLNYNSF